MTLQPLDTALGDWIEQHAPPDIRLAYALTLERVRIDAQIAALTASSTKENTHGS